MGTPARCAKILKDVRAGNYLSTAIEAAGVARGSFYRWMRAGSPEALAFKKSLRGARGAAEKKALATVLAASFESWQAAAWYLERSRPAHWAKRDELTALERDVAKLRARLAALVPGGGE